MQERKSNHILLYLACEQTVFGAKQLQIKNRARQPEREWCTRARQPMEELCTGVRQLPIEDLCDEVKQLQSAVRNLLMEDLCVEVGQL